jgi:hypothetical protein
MHRVKILLLLFGFNLLAVCTQAQCSICTKTASQLGRQSAEGLNGGIVYLMVLPFAIAGYIGVRWWKQEKQNNA